jgi:hypothetical protein
MPQERFDIHNFAQNFDKMKNKRILIFMAIGLVAAYACWKFRKAPSASIPSAESAPKISHKHSDSLNQSINALLQQYMTLAESFIEADTLSIKKSAKNMMEGWSVINDNWFAQDSLLNRMMLNEVATNVASNLQSLQRQTDLTEMRRDFSSLTETMFPIFFNAIQYEGDKLYIQRCPMAFNDEEPASWISRSAEIMNPYLGKKHPVYKAGMLHCGEVVDSIQLKP